MRSYVTPWATGGAVPVADVREPKLTAGGAGLYSMVVIDCSCLRTGLRRAVEAGRGAGGAQHDKRADQLPSLVIAEVGAEPVVAGAVEGDVDGAAGVVGQPDPLAVPVARPQRAVGVLVVVDELDVELAAVRQDEDRGIPDQLVGDDPDHGGHRAAGLVLGRGDVPGRQQPAERPGVLLVEPELVQQVVAVGHGGNHGPHLLVGRRVEGLPLVVPMAPPPPAAAHRPAPAAPDGVGTPSAGG